MEEEIMGDLERAVQAAHGADHVLVKAAEQSPGRTFPVGTRAWIVEHESTTCPHEPRCHWMELVYEYQGRLTLVKESEMPFLTLAALIDRVTGAQQN